MIWYLWFLVLADNQNITLLLPHNLLIVIVSLRFEHYIQLVRTKEESEVYHIKFILFFPILLIMCNDAEKRSEMYCPM